MNELHLSLTSKFLFLLLRFTRLVQDLFSSIYLYSIVKILLTICKWRCSEAQKETKQIIFKPEDSVEHKILWWIYQKLLSINNILNGLHSKYYVYDKILRWNPKVPLIGINSEKVIETVKALGRKEKDGARSLEIEQILSTKVFGHFKILEKKINDKPIDESLDIKCVWLSGKNAGKTFTFSKEGTLNDKNRELQPDSLYYPPELLLSIFEVVFSIGALGTIYQILVTGIKTMASFFPNLDIYKIFSIALNYLKDF